MKYPKSAVTSAFIFTCAFVQAQDNSVGINTNSPNSNAVLELVSPTSDQGFLVPGITSSQRDSMESNTLNLSLESDGAAPSTVDLSPYLDNTDAQDISYNSASGQFTIDNGSTIYIAPASDRRLKENIVLLQNTMEN